MKIRIEVEVEPTELREFLGLPDISGLQEEIVDSVRSRVASGAASLDPKSLFKMFMPEGLVSVSDWQEMFKKAVAEPPSKAKAAKSGKRKTRRRSREESED